MSEKAVKYKHEHLFLEPGMILIEAKVEFMLYTQNNQQFHVYLRSGERLTFTDVDCATVNSIRTQIRQANLWFTEVSGRHTVVWNVQGVKL